MHGYNQHCVWCLIGWARYRLTTSNRVARLHETVRENLSQLIASRDRHPLEVKDSVFVVRHNSNGESPAKVSRCAKPAV